MNFIVVASLSLVVIARAVSADGPYDYVRQCNNVTEICLHLRCTEDQVPLQVPFSYHYSCCKGKLIDEKDYICVGYKYPNGSLITAIASCDPCTEFKCGDGQCTLKQWKCNNVKNCMDGSDEVGCGSCSKDEFYCRDADQCISAEKVCDTVNDCPDGSDELGCQRSDGNKCSSERYRCKTNQCIPRSFACDNVDDCEDGSDEFGRCARYFPRKSGKKRDEISTLEETLFKKKGRIGKNAVDAAQGTIVDV